MGRLLRSANQRIPRLNLFDVIFIKIELKVALYTKTVFSESRIWLL